MHTPRIIALLAVAMPLAAQEPAAPRPVHPQPEIENRDTLSSAALDSVLQRHRNTRCWRARPMPECRMVFLTDIGFDVPLRSTITTDPLHRKSFPARLNWSLGLMRNGDRHSHGVSLSVTSEPGFRFPMIAEYRYRQWRSQFAIDAGIGLKRHEVWVGNGLVPGAGLTTLLGVSPSRWVGASLRYETMTIRGQRFTGVMLGLQSTRVSEYTFQFLGIAIRDWLLGLIGFEWDPEGTDSSREAPPTHPPASSRAWERSST